MTFLNKKGVIPTKIYRVLESIMRKISIYAIIFINIYLQHPCPGYSAWHGRRYRQPVVYGQAGRIRFSQRLLPTATVAACGPVFVGGFHQD